MKNRQSLPGAALLLFSLAVVACDAPPSPDPEQAQNSQAVTDRPPMGTLDGTNGVRVFGWACDPDTPNTPVAVHLYFGGPPGSPGAVYGVSNILANQPSEPAVNNLCAGGSAHRFSWTMPADLRDYLGPYAYQVYAYAVTSTANAHLSGSPKTMTPTAATALSAGYGAGAETLAQTGGVYGYAPTIAYVDGMYRLWACSSQYPYQGDVIIYSDSVDGITWNGRTVVMSRYSPPPGTSDNLAALQHTCDPSVIRYTPPGSTQAYYYMYVTTAGTQGGMMVARSTAPTGPYAFYMGGNPALGSSWNANPPVGVYPARLIASATTMGQSSVVRVGNTLHMWYTDLVNGAPRQFRATSTDGVTWGGVTGTGWADASVDVKYDPVMRRFVMADILPDHMPLPQTLSIATSTDGIHWQGVPVAQGTTSTGLPKYIHNVGLSGDGNGHLMTGARTLVGFGAPYTLNDPLYVDNPNDQLYGTCSGGAPPHCRPYWHVWVAPLSLNWAP